MLTTLIVLIACVAPFGAADEKELSYDLAVMSFNIRYGTARDGDNSWKYRRGIVADTIRTYEPGIVGLQECLDFQAEYLASELADYRWFGMKRELKADGEQMAIFYKKDVLSPMETGNRWLSETPEVPGSSSWNSSCVRMVTWARFFHHDTRQMFFFFNTHLDHMSAAAREGQATVLRDRIKRVPPETPVILTGDFNCKATGATPYEILVSPGLSDAWVVADESKGPSVTSNNFKAPQGENRRIDWILTRGPVHVNYCETVTYNQDGRYPSDHLPVFARLTITH